MYSNLIKNISGHLKEFKKVLSVKETESQKLIHDKVLSIYFLSSIYFHVTIKLLQEAKIIYAKYLEGPFIG